MIDSPLEKLLSISTPALGAEPSSALGEVGGGLGVGLLELLSRTNGFYAFESALHVFPSGTSDRMSVEHWNDEALWRCEYGNLDDEMVFFAEDVFGVQFVLVDSGVGRFDPETGDVDVFAPDLMSWSAEILRDFNVLTGYPIGHEWQLRHGTLAEGNRLVPKVPFVIGGAFDVDNLYAADAVEGMRVRASLAVQIRDLPDGATVRYRIVE